MTYTLDHSPLLCAHCDAPIAACTCPPPHPFTGWRARIYEAAHAQPGTIRDIALRTSCNVAIARNALRDLVALGYLETHTGRLKNHGGRGRCPHVFASPTADPSTLPGVDPNALGDAILALLSQRPHTCAELCDALSDTTRSVRTELRQLRADDLVQIHRFALLRVYSVGGCRPNPEDYTQ